MPVLRTRDQGDSPIVSSYLPVNPPPARWNNLIAGWKMEESAGSPRADVLGTHTMAEIGGTVATTTGHIGTASGVDLEANYLETAIAAPFGVHTGGGVRTVCFWISREVFSGSTIQNVGNQLGVARDPGSWSFESSSPNSCRLVYVDSTGTLRGTGGRSLDDRSYMFFVGWWDADVSAMHIEKDNDLVVVDTPLTSPATGAPTALMFLRFLSNGWVSLDEIYVFSDVKDADWRTEMYNAGVGRQYPG